MKPILAFIICIHFFLVVAGQNKDGQPLTVYEKVYLHTDRELYSPDDTIWFKSYLVSGISNKLLPGFKNVYVQLISSTGKVVSNRLLLSVNGESNGDIALEDSLAEGQYLIRAYTKYLQNFGEESYFHQRIWIAKSGYFNDRDSIQSEKPEFGEVMFFPEGGNLVYNTATHVAFKVIGTDGKGIDANGTILNQRNDTITTFSTPFLGMGRFMLMPKEDEKYFAVIGGYPESRQEITNFLKDGFALNFKDNGNEVLYTVSRNFEKTGKEKLYLEATHKGIQLFREEFEIESFTTAVQISKSRFPEGISKITLRDRNSNIVSERLVFIALNYGNNIQVETNKEEYATREKVELSLEPLLSPNDSVTSTLSVSVVSEDYLGSAGSSQSIKSYLLLESELKGAIESPALYFFDEEKITAAEKLDLLMMVQGWRSYYWDEIIEKAPKDLDGWDDAGITISGYVKRLFRDKDVIGGKVSLVSFSPSILLEDTKTDNFGRFRFERLFLADSAEVMITATNEKGHKNVELITDSLETYETSIDTILIFRFFSQATIPMKYYREIYLQQLRKRDYTIEQGVILLGEVTVSGKFTDEEVYDLVRPFYMWRPDTSYIITKADYQYKNLHGFVEKKVGSKWLDLSFAVSGDPIHSTRPHIMYIIDGDVAQALRLWMEDYNEQFYWIPIKDVYRIDLMRPIELGRLKEMYYVYLKNNRRGFRPEDLEKSIFQVNGFQQPNQFYSPKYTLENINNKMPDYRPTLYWSPEVVVKDDKAGIEFFTCDNLSNYLVIVEGISSNGKICYGVKRFGVTGNNPAIKSNE